MLLQNGKSGLHSLLNIHKLEALANTLPIFLKIRFYQKTTHCTIHIVLPNAVFALALKTCLIMKGHMSCKAKI